ncbi:MAG: hypothetical protein U0U66_00810 [Cytophagaceae bacterium]
MKLKLKILILLILIVHSKSFACNICGGSSGGNYLGILPQFTKNFIGLRYNHKAYYYQNPVISTIGTGRLQNEYYNTIELWGRVYPTKNIQLFFFLPYSVNRRIEDTREVSIQGIGDASILANYQIIKRTADSLKFKHVLLAGFGLKLPTGKYQQRDENKTMFPISFQIGNGAYSFIFNAIYNIRYKRVGINTDFSYRINSTNELYYKPGDQFTYSFSFFYWQNIKNKISFLPQTGIYYENYGKDVEYDITKEGTGGQNMFWNLGMDVYYKRFIVGALLQMPVLADNSYLLPQVQNRFITNVSFMF